MDKSIQELPTEEDARERVLESSLKS